MVRVNYQRDKRLRDLERQRKQEEKRSKKLQKDLAPADPQEGETLEPAPEGPEPEAQV